MIKLSTDLDRGEKLTLIKDRLGWFFGDVRPIDWDPVCNISHLGYLLRMTNKGSSGCIRASIGELIGGNIFDIIMLPFTEEGRSRLVDICGAFLGVWRLP